MGQYLIPANSKKSMLILGVFNQLDLWIFLVGLLISLVLLLILPVDQLPYAITAIAPGAFCAFLVMPIPNYHNVRTFFRVAFVFYTTRQHFVWKGWCFNSGEDGEKQVYRS